ncbi:hypothetical protein MML48_1g14030 [Holotrichia oblita]|uniref:Uncharacterized protein n=1 Tax=Holotrichia oblita TaxID=644536 RepID=A0ACB9TSK4_HOLOL|nr:hypothetical protein MML48_1g14030 [Holotrichia oblita]
MEDIAVCSDDDADGDVQFLLPSQLEDQDIPDVSDSSDDESNIPLSELANRYRKQQNDASPTVTESNVWYSERDNKSLPMAFTAEHDAMILMSHYRSGIQNAEGNWQYSTESCINQFTQRFPNFEWDYDAFRHRRHVVIHRFEERNCICKAKPKGQPTNLTKDVVDNIPQIMQRSPHKSIAKLSQETGNY